MAHYMYIGWECYEGIRHRNFGDYLAWEAIHPLYDGGPDSPTRGYYVTARTLAELKVAIELWERENGLDVTDTVGVEKQMDELYPY